MKVGGLLAPVLSVKLSSKGDGDVKQSKDPHPAESL